MKDIHPMGFSKIGNFFVVLLIAVILISGASFAFQGENTSNNIAEAILGDQSNITTPSGNIEQINTETAPTPLPPPEKLSNPPEVIKAVYATGYSAGTRTYLNYLSSLFKNTEINAVVVDIKGSDGRVSYASGAEEVKKYNLSNKMIGDIDALVRFFHSQNVYVIGRIAVFEDPQYAKARPELAVYNKEKTTNLAEPVLWKDNNGLSWLDPASKDAWDYSISLAKDAFYHGFDEINFDYIRFPSDGNTDNIGFPFYDEKKEKSAVIKECFSYLRSNLPNEKISADLFGLTTVNMDDMGIGQILEDALENFDYVSPMAYPSHYANGFIGFSNPAEHPYEVVKYSMDSALVRKKRLMKSLQEAVLRKSESVGSPAAASQILAYITSPGSLAKIRPWLQDFNMGAFYTADLVKQEIKATQDSLREDYNGFMLWNPSNIYTQGAVMKQN